MFRMNSLPGLTPMDKHQVISISNFDDEGTDAASNLVTNEGEKIGDLVAILKDDALSDNEAIREISEATDVDADVIKEAAETKQETDAAGDEVGASPEEKKEMFFSAWENKMRDVMFSVMERKYESQGINGFLALFSEETIESGDADEKKDLAEAISIVKYVDDAEITEQGADEIADIISEATDADKNIIKEVVQIKEDSIADTANAVSEYFSEVMAEVAAVAGVEKETAVQEALDAFRQQGEDEARRIESGENFLKTNNIHAQEEGDTAKTNTDPGYFNRLPEALANRISEQTAGGYQIANSPANIQLPNIAPGQNFSGRTPMLKVASGAPETVIPYLANRNFGNGDSQAEATVISAFNMAAMHLDGVNR